MTDAFVCDPAQLTQIDDDHYMVAGASQLGLAPGHWPPVLRVGYELYGILEVARSRDGSVRHAIYRNLRPSADHMSIKVLND